MLGFLAKVALVMGYAPETLAFEKLRSRGGKVGPGGGGGGDGGGDGGGGGDSGGAVGMLGSTSKLRNCFFF